MRDHGTQVVASRTDKKGYSKHKFGEFLEENGIKHILARIHHPQTRALELLFTLPLGNEPMVRLRDSLAP